MLAKFAEDDRIEQMNAQKRRMKQQEHKRAVEQLLEERRQQFALERVGIMRGKIPQQTQPNNSVSVCIVCVVKYAIQQTGMKTTHDSGQSGVISMVVLILEQYQI